MSHKNPPNILVYISHDTGQHISPYGIQTVQTPNAERLAEQSTLFTRAFCTAPQCSPSRASIFTGMHPHTNGVMGLTHGNFGWDLYEDQVHLAQHLKNRGYQTAAFGITHETHTADRCGFDIRGGTARADEVGSHVADYLDNTRDPDQPFYLQIGTHETHRAFLRDNETPDDERGVTLSRWLQDTPATRKDMAQYQRCAQRWDRGLGDILDALDKRDLAEDTLLIVTTDHGLPLPRAKMSLYDPGIEVLFMVRWPGHIPQGRRTDAMISNVDVTPTVLETIGDQPTPEMQGVSFAPVLFEGKEEHRSNIFAEKTYHESYDPMRCVRTERYKLIRNFDVHTGTDLPPTAVQKPVYTENLSHCLQPNMRHPYVELYDLASDPLERNNLADDPAYAGIRHELDQTLSDWMHETRDPLLEGPIASPFYHRAISDLPAPTSRPQRQ